MDRVKPSPASATRFTPCVSARPRPLVLRQLPLSDGAAILGIGGELHFALEYVDVLVAAGGDVDAELSPFIDRDGFRRADGKTAGLGPRNPRGQSTFGQKHASPGFHRERGRPLQDQFDAVGADDFRQPRFQADLLAGNEIAANDRRFRAFAPADVNRAGETSDRRRACSRRNGGWSRRGDRDSRRRSADALPASPFPHPGPSCGPAK